MAERLSLRPTASISQMESVRWGGVISPYGVLNLPHEHCFAWCIAHGSAQYKQSHHVSPKQGKSCDGAVKKQKEGRMDDKNVCKKAFVMSVLCIFSIIILAILVMFVGD